MIYRSLQSDDHLIIFVHGFNGSACGTWMQFPDRIVGNPIFQGSDVVYFGYDGLRQQAQDSANIFYDYIDELISNPLDGVQEFILPLLERKKPFSYKRITLVGHSLGAVIIRLAMLTAHKERKPWLELCELVFYAPAHMGSRITQLVSETLLGLPYVAGVGGIAKWRLKVLNDLEEKSELLNLLRQRTEKASRSAPQLRARAIVVTKDDGVVINTEFLEDDPHPSRIDSATHITICKPRSDFEEPAKFLYANVK
jgi:pimeloyl-ACP methyl ester carboxylesterase